MLDNMLRERDLTNGVLYIAFGAAYQAEVRQSILSLRVLSPAVPIAVITDTEWSVDPRPDIFILREKEASYGLKVRYAYDSPFDRTFCLDSDTFIARDISPVFGLLDYYDVGFYFGGRPINEQGGLELQMRAATSVFLFKKNRRVADFFGLWATEYNRERLRWESQGFDLGRAGLDDTRSCALSVAKSEVRPVQLGTLLYFNLETIAETQSPPFVYHGRVPYEMAAVDYEITRDWDSERDWFPRLWFPNIRGLLPLGIRHSDPLLAAALIIRRICNSVRRFFYRRRRSSPVMSTGAKDGGS
jgi:hypothetical protein